MAPIKAVIVEAAEGKGAQRLTELVANSIQIMITTTTTMDTEPSFTLGYPARRCQLSY